MSKSLLNSVKKRIDREILMESRIWHLNKNMEPDNMSVIGMAIKNVCEKLEPEYLEVLKDNAAKEGFKDIEKWLMSRYYNT